MTQNSIKSDFWNEYFRLYDVLNRVYPYQRLLNSVLAEMDLTQGKSALDAGAGTGNLAVHINKTGAEVVGLDYSEVGLNIFREKLPTSKAIQHDLKHPIPLPDNSFDYICCINILFAINPEHRQKICREFYRLLKPGGKIVMTNLSVGYKPIRIYVNHMSEEINRFGLIKALINLTKLIGPTIKMFYYSQQMRKEDKSADSISFFRPGEQDILLESSGFSNVTKERKLFAKQAVMSCGFKV
ncbi:MAG: methyltransferase domain-containing protein [bacterium]